MKNIKKVLSFMLLLLSVFCIFGVTSCSVGSKNLYIKPTRNFNKTIENKSSKNQMSYKLSNGIIADLVDETADTETTNNYKLTVYTSNYSMSIKDSDKLSKALFGIGLNQNNGGFQDNNYKASTAVLYASTDKDTNVSEVTNLSTLVYYVGNKLDVTKVNETQDLIIKTEVLKHETQGTYTVDSTYDAATTLISLTISDDEAPIGWNGSETNINQETIIDEIISKGDSYSSSEKTERVESALKKYIEKMIKSPNFISDNVDEINNIDINVSMVRDYDYANLEITDFKDDGYKIPFNYTLTDSNGNTSKVFSGDLKVILKDNTSTVIESITHEKNVLGSKEKLEKCILSHCGFDISNYDVSVIEDTYSSIDLVSNYTNGTMKDFGRIDHTILNESGKDVLYLLGLLKSTSIVQYTKKYKNHILVNSDGSEIFEESISYIDDAKFDDNYGYKNNGNVSRTIWKELVETAKNIDELKGNFQNKLSYYFKDNDNLETQILILVAFTREDNSKYRISIYCYGEYHSECFCSDFSGVVERDNYEYIKDYVEKQIKFSVDLTNNEE